MTSLFYSIDASVALVQIVLLTVALFCGGHILVRRTFAKTQFIEHNEVAGFIVAVVGVLYAVLLAFVTVVVWEHYDQSQDRARSEVDAATDIWRLARHLPSPNSQRIRADVKRFAASVLSDEWPKMRAGAYSPITQREMVTLTDDIAAYEALSKQQGNLQNRLLDRVQVVSDFRRHRIYDTTSGAPIVLWVALVIGSFTVVGFVYLFGMINFRVQLLMTAAVAIMIGLCFGTILELDYPFRGTVSVSPERWAAFVEMITRER